ncbi:MAG: quinone-dependent dihydroorotate dehydrogenase [Trueperaceae bacterium]
MYRFLRPLLFAADAEFVHNRTLSLLQAASGSRAALSALAARFQLDDSRLAVERFGLRFPNPLGLAAGMDKDGRALAAWQALGFGFCEVGSVTAQAQPGNPRPRVFRLPQDGAIINRMGFNNEGASNIAGRVAEARRKGRLQTPVLINVGKSRAAPLDAAAADYRESLQLVWPQADAIVINVSSPNTPGLRTLQDPAALAKLLAVCDELYSQRPMPLLLKLAPDLTDEQLGSIVELTTEHRVAGLVAVNTTLSRNGLKAGGSPEGGLSGRPLATRSVEVLRLLARQTELPIVSVGGVFDSRGLIERLRAGACLVELYTGFVYGGPGTVRSMLTGLLAHLEIEGLADVESLIGVER